MSKAPLPDLIEFDTAKAVVLAFIPDYIAVWRETVTDAIASFIDDVRDLDFLGALNTAISVFTRLPYLPLIAGVDAVGHGILRHADYYRRFCITGEDAARLVVKVLREVFLNNAWLVDDNIVDLLIQQGGRLIFGFLTKSSLLHKILKFLAITSPEDVMVILNNSKLKSIYLTAVRVFMIWLSLGFTMMGYMVVALNWGKLFKPLAQDSRRVFGKRPGLHRVNAGKGPDRPS